MGITISGENNNDRILASDGVIDSLSGVNVAGVITATSFTGDLTGDVTGNLTGNVTGNINNSTLLLQTGGYERLRISSNGDVTTTGASYSRGNAGFTARKGDSVNITRASGTPLEINRTGNDGPVINFFQDQSIIGSIGVDGADVWFGANGTSYDESVRITSSGKIGIGTDNPDHNLHIYKYGGDAVITLESQGNGNHSALEFFRTSSSGDSKGAGSIYVTGDTSTTEAKMKFAVGHNVGHEYTPSMVIRGNGEVGIGTDDPSTMLHIKSTFPTLLLDGTNDTVGYTVSKVEVRAFFYRKAGFTISGDNGTEDIFIGRPYGSGDATAPLVFNFQNEEKVRFTSDGKVGIGTVNPKTKLNIHTFPSTATGGILVQNTNYSSNEDRAYLIAGTQTWTGAATDWSTYGFQHKLKSDGSGVPRLTIDASAGGSQLKELITFMTSGRVGIGTDDPQDMVTIRSGVNETTLRLVDTSNSNYGAHFSFYDTENEVRIGGIEDTVKRAAIRIDRDADDNSLYISNDGKVGIGTDDPSASLHVYHATTNGVAVFQSGDAFCNLILQDSNSTTSSKPQFGVQGDDFRFISYDGSESTEKLRIDSKGQVIFKPMTTTQRNALTAQEGGVIYNSTDHKLQVYNGTAWVDLH